MNGQVVIVGALVVVQLDAAGGWVARTGAPELVQTSGPTGALPASPPLVYDGDDAELSPRGDSSAPPALPLEQLVAACLRGVWRATNGR
jgi:hypothetical protein